MKKRAQIALSIVASVLSVAGLAFIAGTLTHVKNLDQLQHLLSFDYMSFTDSRAEGAIGSAASDFYIGVALALVGSVLLTKVERVGPSAKVIAALLFAFVAVSLAYACGHLRVGVKPY